MGPQEGTNGGGEKKGPRRCRYRGDRLGGNFWVSRQDKAAPEGRISVGAPNALAARRALTPAGPGGMVAGVRTRPEAVAVALGAGARKGGCPCGGRIPATYVQAVKAFVRGW